MKKIIIPVLLVCAILILFPKNVCDDSYILFRYADNFKAGNGLVWNPGEYTESYTGILSLIFLIISPFSYVITSWIVGILGFLIGGYFLCLLLKDNPVKWLIMICYFFSPAIYVHIFGGLETTLFIGLSFAAIYLWKENKEFWLLLITILLLFCRPEGAIYTILLLIKNKEDEK